MPALQKLSALIVGIMMLSSVGQGGVYIIADDVMQHMFWVNTDGTLYRFGNQLLLPAVITDYRGNIITTDAMVTYDAVHGNNVNLIHYGNYCILGLDWNLNGTRCNIAQTSSDYLNITWLEDNIYHAYEPSIAENFSGVAGQPEFLDLASGSANDLVANAAEQAPGPAASDSGGFYIRNTYMADRFYLHDTYRVGDPNFNFCIITLTVQNEFPPYATTEGLLFLQTLVSGGHQVYVAIITVFKSELVPAYSMAGIYDPQNSSETGHYFVMIQNLGVSTTVY